MSTSIVVPQLGESVVEATITRWLKNEGDRVSVGDILLELETEKVNLEVGSEHGGVLTRIAKHAGDDVRIGDVIGEIDEAAPASSPAPAAAASANGTGGSGAPAAPPDAAAVPYGGSAPGEPAPGSSITAAPGLGGLVTEPPAPVGLARSEAAPPPAAGAGVNAAQNPSPSIDSTVMQPGGEGVSEPPESAPMAGPGSATPPPLQPAAASPQAAPTTAAPSMAAPASAGAEAGGAEGAELVERVKLTRRRRTIARNLVEAQHSAAMLTTFNEVDMTRVTELRRQFKERFEKRHGIKLGLMSFFVKAAVAALKAYPVMNAELQGEDVLYKKYFDIGVAMDTPEGLIVPVLRGADAMSAAAIERAIRDFQEKSQKGGLTLDDLRGGCFTITNGGIFGSLLSTPILNAPQVGILGLHRIEERPVAVAGQVVIHPMMYVALSYDHRLIDGRVAVQFLARIKELVEEPSALLLEE